VKGENRKMTFNKRKLFRWSRLFLLIYAILGIAIYWLQDFFLFRPEPLGNKHRYAFTEPHREVNLQMDANSLMNIVQFSCRDSVPRGVVLYFHGNRKNIGWYARYAHNFTQYGYEVWMLDYPGYGKSTGSFSEQRLYDYASQLYLLARKKYGADQLIIYGKSMGTGIAAELASRHSCRRLILETPYYSLTSLASHYFPIYPVGQMIRYKIPTWKYLQQVSAPVTILHGTADGVIPYSNSKQLMEVLKPGDEYVTIAGGSHNDLDNFPLFHRKLDSLLSLSTPSN